MIATVTSHQPRGGRCDGHPVSSPLSPKSRHFFIWHCLEEGDKATRLPGGWGWELNPDIELRACLELFPLQSRTRPFQQGHSRGLAKVAVTQEPRTASGGAQGMTGGPAWEGLGQTDPAACPRPRGGGTRQGRMEKVV